MAATALGLSAVAGVAASPARAAATDGTITSDGPLPSIQTTADLNCAVSHVGDTAPEFYGATACATLIAAGGVLYGPAAIPAGSGASPRTAWTPRTQESSGSGTSADPYRIVTVVSGGSLVVTQTDTYVVGSEAYGTRISIENTDSAPVDLTLYRAGDCFLQNSDVGYGSSDPSAGSVACTTGSEPGSRIEQWAPLTPGSHFYESFYGNVWTRIGQQQPFPDTSEDGTNQDNGAGLSWTTTLAAGSTASFSHLTAFSPTGSTDVSDTDGDSFPDSWEEAGGGVDTNGDGTLDLRLSDYGATPDRPDVFVQVNWTQTRSCTLWIFSCSTTNRRPSLAALRDVQGAFAAHGVRMHIDAGSQSVMNPDTGATWGNRSEVRDAVSAPARIAGANSNGFDWGAQFQGIRDDVLSDARARIFHLALYVGSYSGGSSGISRSSEVGFAGHDFMLAYDVFGGRPPTRQEEAGTFMHELGHNLGLSHGGSSADALTNYKPNYPSVMNYFWQFSGVPKNDSLGLLDYSEGTLAAVDEHSLTESVGLEPDAVAGNIGTKWACPNGTIRGPSPSVRDVDWNCDGSISSTADTANVTAVLLGDGTRSDLVLSELRDHSDWASLVYDGGGSLGGAGDPAAVPAISATSEPTFEQLIAATTDLHSVGLSSPGQLVMQTGTTSPVQITVTNNRPGPVTYRLSQIADGVTLGGIPPTVALAPGASTSLTATLTAGPVSDSAFFEVDADVADDPSNTGRAVTQVYVVDGTVTDQPLATGALDHIAVTPASSTTPAGTPVTFTVSGFDAAQHALGTPPGTTLSIAPDGTCTATSCTATAAGPHIVTATSGTKTATATVTVVAGSAATVTKASGDGQSANPGQTFPSPLEVVVADTYGNPVGGAPVTFTISSGATFSTGGTTSAATSASNGRAVSAALKAGSTASAFTVTASTPGATAAVFAETVASTGRQRADLALRETAPSRVAPGQEFTVTAVLKNNGPNDSGRTVTALTVPRGTQVVRVSNGGTTVTGAVLFRTTNLRSGQSVTYTVTLRADPNRQGTLTLGGVSLSGTSDPVRLNNLSSAMVRVAR